MPTPIWTTEATTAAGPATLWAEQRGSEWTFDPSAAEDGTPYFGVFLPPSRADHEPDLPFAEDDLYAFHVVIHEGRFGVAGSDGRDIGRFDTLAAALTAGADWAEGSAAD